MSHLSQLYDLYFTPNASGESTYDARFGEFDIPLIEVITKGNLIIDQFFKAEYGYAEDLTSFDQEDFIESLIARIPAYGQMKSGELYSFIISELLEARKVHICTHFSSIEINILDFGCGNGRYLKLYDAMARALKPLNASLNIFNYDPSPKGLQIYVEKARDIYSMQETRNSLRRDNLSLIFILGDENKSPLESELARINTCCAKYLATSSPGPHIDLTFCDFGTICHITNYKQRIQTIRMLGEATREEVLISPNTNQFLANGNVEIADYDPTTSRASYYKTLVTTGEKIKIPVVIYNGNADLNREVAQAGYPIQFLTMRAASIAAPFETSHDLKESFAELARTGTSQQPTYDYVIFNSSQLREPGFASNRRINDAMGRMEYFVSPQI